MRNFENGKGNLKNVFRKSLIVLLSLSFVFTLSACGGGSPEDALERIQESGKVTIGFSMEPPYAYEEDGELKGAAVRIAEAIFAELGVEEVEGVLQQWDNLIPGLQSGKYDVITAGMAITPERCENVDFGEPEIQYGEGIVVEKGNPKNIKSYADIAADEDITVAVMSGATEVAFLKESGVSESQILQVSDVAAGIAAVQAGRADVTTATEMTVKQAMLDTSGDALEYVVEFEQPDIDGVPSYGAAAFHPDADELREAYNEVLKEFKESGKLLEIIEDELWGELNLVDPSLTTADVCAG